MKGHVSKDMTLNERALPLRYIFGALIVIIISHSYFINYIYPYGSLYFILLKLDIFIVIKQVCL
jgi:hypothetical protein